MGEPFVGPSLIFNQINQSSNHLCIQIMLFLFLFHILFTFSLNKKNGNVFLLSFKFSFIFPLFHKNKSMNHESCRFSPITTINDTAMVPYDFDNPINHADKDCEEDCDLAEELARLLRQESKVIQPHEESVEVINLGTEEEVKEVRICATLQEDV